MIHIKANIEAMLMNLIMIDETKCKRDGICAAECPLNLINPPGKNKFPSEGGKAEELCIHCGHCVSVCPHGALSLRNMSPKECFPLDSDLRPSAEQVEFLLQSRRSIRVYKDKPVNRKAIARIIDMARYAPSGHNNQLVEWLVIYDKKDVQKYTSMVIDWLRFVIKESPEMAAGFHMDLLVKAWEEGNDRVCRNAPHMIIAHGPERNMMIQSTCTIAMTYLELAASSLQLGACWAGYFNRAAANWPPLKQALGFPEENNAFGAMMLGHPKYKYHRIPLRKEAKIMWK